MLWGDVFLGTPGILDNYYYLTYTTSLSEITTSNIIYGNLRELESQLSYTKLINESLAKYNKYSYNFINDQLRLNATIYGQK